MANFFTADLHLGHKAILRHTPARQGLFGDDLDAMDTYLIDRINEIVGRKDTLWILGDFIWKASRYGHYRQRLKVAELNVVTGNHDTPSLRKHVSSLNDMVYRKINGQYYHMAHYPMASWRNREHGAIHLYGHSHGTLEEKLDTCFHGRLAMDVGVDNAFRLLGDWRPFSFDDLRNHLGDCYE